MSPFDTQSFQELSVPKTGMEQFKEHLKNTPGALVLATVILAMSALDNSAQATENTIRSPIAATKSLKTEKKLPQIAEENEQIYEFLEGNITKNDTLASLQKKLAKKIRSLSSGITSDDFSYYVGMEMLYRQDTGKTMGEALSRAIEQIKNEHDAAEKLRSIFTTLKTEDIANMNKALVDYYNAIGGNTWGEEEMKQWGAEIQKERKNLGYTYADVEKWMRKSEAENRKAGPKKIRM